MALNNPNASQTEARKPRVRVLINGTDQSDTIASFSGGAYVDGLIDADITVNNWYVCDRFNLTFAIIPASPFTMAWWSQQTDCSILVQLGILPDGQIEGAVNVPWVTVIQGGADTVTIDPVVGTVAVEGRDLSYLLIESRTQEEFNNHTSSQVVTELAKRHGLTPVVTATSNPVHRYYDRDHTKTTHGEFHRQITEWDLCVFLAQNEGFDLFVIGKELHFQPKAPPNANPFIVRYTPSDATTRQRLNTTNLRMSRSLLLAKDINVEVRSWSTKQGSAVTAIAHKTGFGRVSAAGNSRAKGGASVAQNYVYILPGLTKDQAQQAAEQRLKDLSQHERVIEFDMPGNLLFNPRSKVKLVGTGTSWDQDYFIDHIRYRISYASGWTLSARAKNVDTGSQVLTE